MGVSVLRTLDTGEANYLDRILDYIGDSDLDLMHFMSSSEKIIITDFDENDVTLEFLVADDSLVWTLRNDDINYYWRCA